METSRSHGRDKAVGNMHPSSWTEPGAGQRDKRVISDTTVAQLDTYVHKTSLFSFVKWVYLTTDGISWTGHSFQVRAVCYFRPTFLITLAF